MIWLCEKNTNFCYCFHNYPLGFIHSCVWAHPRFACLSSDWATTTGRLLGPTICLPHEDGGILPSALPKDTTNKLAGLFSTLFLLCWAPSREAVNTIFKSLLVWLDLENEPQVYRLRSGSSNHYAIAPVIHCVKSAWPGEPILLTLTLLTGALSGDAS